MLLVASVALAAPHKKKPSSDDAEDKDSDSVTVTDDDGDPDADKPRAKKKAKAKDADDDTDADKPHAKKKTKDADDDTDADKPHVKKKTKDADEDAEADRPRARKKRKAADDDEDSERPRAKKKLKDIDKDGDTDADREQVRVTTKRRDKAKDADGDTEEPPAKPKGRTKAKDPETEAAPEPPRGKAKITSKGRGKAKDKNADIGAEIEMDGEESTSDVPRAEAAPLPGMATEAAVTPEAPTSGIPLAIDERSLTLPKDKLEVHGGFPISVLTLPGATPGTTTSTTSEGLALGVTYGVDDKTEFGADYALSLSPGNVKGPLTFHGAHYWVHNAKLEVAIAGAIAIDFIEVTNAATMMTTTSTSFGLQFGAWARYHVAPKVSLFTGLPALPDSSASLSKLSFALPPLPYQLALGLNNGGAIALELPAGIGYQASPKLYTFAMVNLANIKISNTQNAFLFKDFIPIALGAFYALDKLDIGAVLADDLEQGTGYLRFQLVGRYLLK